MDVIIYMLEAYALEWPSIVKRAVIKNLCTSRKQRKNGKTLYDYVYIIVPVLLHGSFIGVMRVSGPLLTSHTTSPIVFPKTLYEES